MIQNTNFGIDPLQLFLICSAQILNNKNNINIPNYKVPVAIAVAIRGSHINPYLLQMYLWLQVED